MIRVLIVDDSSFMRVSLTHILESEKSIEVVGTAADGRDAIRLVKRLHPNVVLLDIAMPVMDGLAALAHIMADCPTPVLMLSGLNKREAGIAVKSLEHGAVDFIPKPSGVISYDVDKLRGEILTKVKIAAGVNVRKLDFRLPQETFQHRPKPVTRKRIVVIGASTGGPRAVVTILSGLGRDISAGLVVVQHMTKEFIPSFVDRLQGECTSSRDSAPRGPLKISTAQDDAVIRSGQIFIAPGGCHTTIVQDRDIHRIRLSRKSSPYAVFPSIDYAMESAASAYGGDTLGVLLTGMGSDGARGMKAIKDAGGSTIVEDRSTCAVFGMPKAAIELGGVDEIVPLPHIAQTILRMICTDDKF